MDIHTWSRTLDGPLAEYAVGFAEELGRLCRSRVKVDPGLRVKMDPPRRQRDHISAGGEASTKSW